MHSSDSKERLLDVDTIIEILLFLPVKSLVRFSCVCKSWKNLITRNEFFVRSHLNRAKANNMEILMYSKMNFDKGDEECFGNYDLVAADDRFMNPRKSKQLPNTLFFGRNFVVAGCCDGIVCYYKVESGAIYLWNPALHQCRTILTQGRYNLVYYYDFLGFCYDPREKDYKIVKVSFRKISVVELYSLKQNSWKSVGVDSSFTYRIKDQRLECRCTPLDFKGCMHWIAEIRTHEEEDKGEYNVGIVAFDVADEKHSLLKVPSSLSISTTCAYLGILKGCLSFIATANGSEWEVWSMKVYGVAESWTRGAVVDLQLISCLRPIGFYGSNERLLLLKEPHDVLLYDIGSGSRSDLCNLVGKRTRYNDYFVANYVESLVSVMPYRHPSEQELLPSKPS